MSQRSLLSPILFVLYINDHPINMQGAETVFFFGDDTNILIEDKNY